MKDKINQHSFLVEDAEKYGVDAAVILYNIRYWLSHVYRNLGKDKCKNIDGYVWTFNSAKAFAEQFTYFSSNKIQKILKRLENEGVIICGNFNKKGYDRTKWYTMPEYKIDDPSQPNESNLSANQHIPFSQTAEPIPDNKQQILNNNNTPIVPNGDNTQFFDTVKKIYNDELGDIQRIEVLNSSRTRRLKAIIKQFPNFKNEEKWRGFFKYVKTSSLVRFNGSDGGWKVNFDWIIADKNFVRIVEGQYHTN